MSWYTSTALVLLIIGALVCYVLIHIRRAPYSNEKSSMDSQFDGSAEEMRLAHLGKKAKHHRRQLYLIEREMCDVAGCKPKPPHDLDEVAPDTGLADQIQGNVFMGTPTIGQLIERYRRPL